MAENDIIVGNDDLRSLVLQLAQEVQGLKEQLSNLQVSDRLDDLEEQLVELGTEVRLQARRSSIAVSQLQLPLAHLGCSSAGGTAAASPRVAGPLSASATPRGNTMAMAAAAGGAHTHANAAAAEVSRGLQTAALQSSRDGSKQEANSGSSGSGGSGIQAGSSRSGATVGAAAGTATAAKLAVAQCSGAAATPSEPHLGMFEAVKHWGEDALDSSNEIKQAMQLVATAAAAAAEAQAAASRCQQQVLELRGRQGQAERRLDTLWQLQETSSQNQAALARMQRDVQQGQQQLQQQQQNMVAVRAQIQQLDIKCDGNSSTSSQQHQNLHELQQQVDAIGRDVQQVQDQMVQQRQSLGASKEELEGELQKVQQQLQQQLDEQQQALVSCAGAAGSALDKCEQLRQGAVVMAGRLDGVSSQMQEAVQPLKDRLTAVETTVTSWSSAAGLSATAVQQGQLTAALAQLSAAATRQAHDLTAQLSGLTARLEVLEGEAARQAQVVMQDEFKRQLSQLHSDIEVAVLTATNLLSGQIKAKADLVQLNSSSNSLSARLSASEKSLLLGLKSVGDKTALLLQHKADAAVFDAWKQQAAEDLAQIRAELVQALKAVQAGSAQAVHAVHASIQAAAGGKGMLGTSSAEQAADAAPAEAAGDVLVLPLLSASGCSAEQQKAAATGSGHQHSVGECVAAAEAALRTPRSPQEHQAAAAAAVTCSPGGGVAAMIFRPLTGGTGSSSLAMGAGADGKISGVQASRSGSKQRPPSVQPEASSSPTPAAASDIHSAALNAKLAKAARDKQSARARALQSKGLVAALIHSRAAPSPSEVAEALQQQLNVMGITAAAGAISEEAAAAAAGANDAQQQGQSSAAAAGAEAAGHALESALTASAAAGTLAGSTDGTGRLVMSAGSVGLGFSTHIVGRLPQPHSAAEAAQAVGTLSATGLTFSLRQQSATPHIASGAGSSKAAGSGLFRTGSVGLPVRSSMSAVSQLDRQQLQMQQSPTADELRALLRSGSAAGSKGSAAAMPAVSLPGTSIGVATGSSSLSAAVTAEEQGAAAVGRLSPIAYIKQTSAGRKTQ